MKREDKTKMNNDLSINNADEEKILFVVNTEFALLIAILHYLENLSQSGQAVFIILKWNDTRFKNISFDHLPGEYYLFKNDMTESAIFPDRQFEQILYMKNVTQIVFQHHYDVLTQMIMQRYLKENNSIPLTVINDGLTKSIDIKGLPRLKLLCKMLFRKYFNGYRLLSFKRYRLDIRSYINCYIADENIGVEHFINVNNLLSNILKYEKKIRNIYNFNDGLQNFENQTMIFFTEPIKTDPYLTNNQRELYIKVLYALSNLAKTKKIPMVLKIHPQEDCDEYRKFTNEFVTIHTNKNVPAEVILKLIKKKLIISMMSSLSLYEDKQNKHFWLYKLMNYEIDESKEKKFIIIPDDFETFQKQTLQYMEQRKVLD